MKDYFNKKQDDLGMSNENCIQFEMDNEEKEEAKSEALAYSNVPLDDIHTLDLPILYYQAVNDLQVIDFYEESQSNVTSDEQKKLMIKSTDSTASAGLVKLSDLTSESYQMYGMLSKRAPFTFAMYKTQDTKAKENNVCKLPLLFFWIRKPWVYKYDKNTGSESIRGIVEDLTGINIEKLSRSDIDRLLSDVADTVSLKVDSSTSPVMFEAPRPSSTSLVQSKKRLNSDTTNDTPRKSNAQDLIQTKKTNPQLKDKETQAEKTTKMEKANQTKQLKTTQQQVNKHHNDVATSTVGETQTAISSKINLLNQEANINLNQTNSSTSANTTINNNKNNNNIIINNNQTITTINQIDNQTISLQKQYQ